MSNTVSRNKLPKFFQHDYKKFFEDRRSPQEETTDKYVELKDIPTVTWESFHSG